MILGIDPGFAITGFAVLDDKKIIDCGVIKTFPKESFPDRLKQLMVDIKNILSIYDLEACAIEKIYFSNNQKTAINVAQARGVVLACLAEANISIVEYTPSQIKKAITGSGTADKGDVQKMVKRLLDLDAGILQDDACDAVAVAYCHTDTLNFSF